MNGELPVEWQQELADNAVLEVEELLTAKERKYEAIQLLMRMDVVIRVCNDALPENYAPGKVHTVYNGVRLPELPIHLVAERPFTLLMVGSINDNKNQLLALKLLELHHDLRLILVGDGPREREWQQWARLRGLNERVQWTGFVDTPEQFYPMADALLMLSAYEAFPYAVLEAMSYAVPVVATCVGGIPEAITHEESGLLLSGSNLGALSDAVQRLKSDRPWCKLLGLQARNTVADRFTVTKMTDDLLQRIDDAARKKRLLA
jgi:glycosyltransferase involved in cell wall biosynthesis